MFFSEAICLSASLWQKMHWSCRQSNHWGISPSSCRWGISESGSWYVRWRWGTFWWCCHVADTWACRWNVKHFCRGLQGWVSEAFRIHQCHTGSWCYRSTCMVAANTWWSRQSGFFPLQISYLLHLCNAWNIQRCPFYSNLHNWEFIYGPSGNSSMSFDEFIFLVLCQNILFSNLVSSFVSWQGLWFITLRGGALCCSQDSSRMYGYLMCITQFSFIHFEQYVDIATQYVLTMQIRKMIGTAVAVFMDLLPPDTIPISLARHARVVLPLAPSDGLILASNSFTPFRIPSFHLKSNSASRRSVHQAKRQDLPRLEMSKAIADRVDSFNQEVLMPEIGPLVSVAAPTWSAWIENLERNAKIPESEFAQVRAAWVEWREHNVRLRQMRMQINKEWVVLPETGLDTSMPSYVGTDIGSVQIWLLPYTKQIGDVIGEEFSSLS